MRRTTAALAMLVLTLVGCARADEDSEPPPAPDAAVVTPATNEALRVLLAVVVLVAGDVDAAVAEGIVTPEELDRASLALDEGTVAAWVEQARETIARD